LEADGMCECTTTAYGAYGFPSSHIFPILLLLIISARAMGVDVCRQLLLWAAGNQILFLHSLGGLVDEGLMMYV
jgi:hypothetical protein